MRACWVCALGRGGELPSHHIWPMAKREQVSYKGWGVGDGILGWVLKMGQKNMVYIISHGLTVRMGKSQLDMHAVRLSFQ